MGILLGIIKKNWVKVFSYQYFKKNPKNSFRNKTYLNAAQKNDQKGHYGIDGVSFDGERTYVNGK